MAITTLKATTESELAVEKRGSAVRRVDREFLMKKIQGIASLFETVNVLAGNDWIYTNLEKWEQRPDQAVFYHITEEEIDVLEEEYGTVENTVGEPIPRSLEQEDIETWLDVQTLQAISQIIQKNIEVLDQGILIKAVNHYREYDDFMEL
ncbi:hypothetical protein P0D91_01200 [Pseudomonas sp. CBSPBW29]|uniref:hypothetical protein n=1 Tax=Pseudomonas TaxID=286 RepID=UPI0021AC1453|nr:MULTISPECIES: hypothetical protein [unclassified Pseudomonas]WEL43024.1 hypothetical protein P0D91_01200 [Pseudomonas sp. CBSPBW29]WEL64094.1 hypothetical protein P0D93_28780 [Pseudomonas sp. CBSPGW29]WEL73282.1 hypothetical protein P0D94_14690 [Pseudomonas sp. CBSPCGW29]WEL74595.1 hypothetical protein P0D92_20740 [Pseudomonas sp. CBSPAW29]WEL81165.1 hypothetical protein P0D95_25075 [Pseudomonas sp. CBSPCAW29]WEL89673.1 hypothetical protein P0D90_07410 [Pseudomonas sp. CBSPCBW29]